MKTLKHLNLLIIIAILTGSFILFSFHIPQDKKKPAPWPVPAKYEKMKNPYAGKTNLNTTGKMLYSKHCKSCHGSKGLGDGPKAAMLKTTCGDFSSAAFQKNSDGAIYYYSFVGRDEMPNFEKKFPDEEDRWAIVNFIRTLKK
ncbi:c-type cytochrome [candidate division KSB1 bacterium]